MLIPIGHRDSSVRRLPWVTYGFILICFAVLIGTDTSGKDVDDVQNEAFAEAVQYWRDYRYLDPAPEIVIDVSYDVPPNQRSQYIPVYRSMVLAAPPARGSELWNEQQAELDRLTAIGLGELTEGLSDTPFHRYGVVPSAPRPHTFLTYMFMHAGWIHLLGNMFLLFIMAPAIEDRFGRPIYAGLLAFTGIAAAATHAAITTSPALPLVGASGALAGVLGAFAVRFTTTDIKFAYFLRGMRGTFECPAWVMLPLWFMNEVLQAYLQVGYGLDDGIGYLAHVGGFVAGAGAAFVIKQQRIEERFVHDQIEAKVTVSEGNPVVEEALGLREQEQDQEAYALLQQEVATHPEDPDAALAFWDVCVTLQCPEQATASVGRLVAQTIESDPELAVQYWTELTNLVPDSLIAAPILMRLLPALQVLGMEEAEALALRHACDPNNSGLSAAMALRIVEETRTKDPATALRAAHHVLGFDDIHEEKRAKIETIVAELEAAGARMAPSATEDRQVAEAPVWDKDGTIALENDEDASVAQQDFMANRNSTDLEAELREAAEAPRALAHDGSLVDEDAPPPLSPAALPPPIPAVSEASAEPSATASVMPPPIPLDPAPTPPAPDAHADLTGASQSDPELAAAEGLGELGEGTRFPTLKVLDASPTRLDETRIVLATADGRNMGLPLDRIDAIAVAAVQGLSAKAVVVVDLVLNWSELDATALRSLRLRSDSFDPRPLAPNAENGTAALREFLAELGARSGAVLLPSPEAGRGTPFHVAESLEAYEREVLKVG